MNLVSKLCIKTLVSENPPPTRSITDADPRESFYDHSFFIRTQGQEGREGEREGGRATPP